VLAILLLDPQFSIDLQLIGGVIILQTLPSVGLGLITRWFHRGGLVIGWAAGMAAGMWMLYRIPNPANGHKHFGGSAYALSDIGLHTKMTVYVGAIALAVNLVVAVLVTLVLKAAKTTDGVDATRAEDYVADEEDPKVVQGIRGIDEQLVT
jgi:SSS family solute:Na+ symporter